MVTPDIQSSQLEPEEIQPTMIIGLGGTGKKILTRLKTRFIQNFNEVPKNIRLTCFDIDRYEEVDTFGEYTVRLTPNEEFFGIGDVPAGDILRQVRSTDHLYPELRSWINPYIPLQEANLQRGGQQNRQLGRLALYWNVQTRDFMNILENKYLELRQQKGDIGDVSSNMGNNVVVYIIGSLAGGTGSGMVLDTAFIMRYIAESMGLAEDTSIVGVLVLPRVFNMVNMEAIQPNAMAALQEIDYFMTQPYKERKFSEIPYYADFKISSTVQPFNICYVVDAIGAGGKALVGPEHLFPMIVDAVYLLAASKMGSQAWSNINNIGRVFTGRKVFSSFGVSSLVFPAFEIHHLCAAKISAEVIQDVFLAKGKEPVEPEIIQRDVDRFLIQLRLDSGDTLVDELGVGADGQKLRFNLQDDDRLSDSRLKSIERNVVHTRISSIVNELLAEWDLAARSRLEANRDNICGHFHAALNDRIQEIVDSPDRGIKTAQQFIKELTTRLRTLEVESEGVSNSKETAAGLADERFASRGEELKKSILERGLFKRPIEGRRDAYLEAAQERMNAYVAKEVAVAGKQASAIMLEDIERVDRKLGDLVKKLEQVQKVYLKSKEKIYWQEIQGMDAVRRLPITRRQDIERIYDEYRQEARQKIVQSLLGETGLLVLANHDSDEIGNVIFQSSLKNMRNIYQIRVEDMIPQRETEKEKPVARTEWLTTVEKNAEVFWRYEQAVAQAGAGLGQTIQVIGVEDTAKSIFKGQGSASRSYCSTSDAHMITVLQMTHGLDFRHMSQIRTYEANYKAALRQGRSPHVFPEFDYGSDDDHKWFALGVAFGLIERRGPFWIIQNPNPEDSEDDEIFLAEHGSLADAVWRFNNWPRTGLINFVQERVNVTMWGKTVAKEERRNQLKSLQHFRSEFEWLGNDESIESEWIKERFDSILDAYIRETEDYLALQ